MIGVKAIKLQSVQFRGFSMFCKVEGKQTEAANSISVKRMHAFIRQLQCVQEILSNLHRILTL